MIVETIKPEPRAAWEVRQEKMLLSWDRISSPQFFFPPPEPSSDYRISNCIVEASSLSSIPTPAEHLCRSEREWLEG